MKNKKTHDCLIKNVCLCHGVAAVENRFVSPTGWLSSSKKDSHIDDVVEPFRDSFII